MFFLVSAVMTVAGSQTNSTPRPTMVVFNFNKSRELVLGGGTLIGYVEERDSFSDGSTRRSTVVYSGNSRLKAPVSVEIFEIVGLPSFLAII